MEFSIVLLIVAFALLIFHPVTETQTPDPQINVESARYVNGRAEFLYKPGENESYDLTASYASYRESELVESIEQREYSQFSIQNPIRVFVDAESDQEVSVQMLIRNTGGELLHNSSLVLEGSE